MNSYCVTDVRPPLRLAALRDTLGRRHVVRLRAEMPEVGAELRGPALRTAGSVLLADGGGQVFDVSVDAMECAEQYVLERLHAPVAVAGQRRALPPEADMWTPAAGATGSD